LEGSIDIGKEEPQEKTEEKVGDKPVSDKALIIGAAIIILAFVFFISFVVLSKSQPKTIEELHLLNIQGKLRPEQGYMYNGVYSFVTDGDVWYTQLQTPEGERLFNLAFRYGPKDVEDVKISGFLNLTLFEQESAIYVTFNPLGSDFSHVALAVGDFDTHMIKAFGKEIIAACDTNETVECETRPLITCDNTDKPVLYIQEDVESEVILDNNCIIVKGSDFDLVKGVDRVLYQFYNIMD